jgi:hypothetical protein
VQLIDKSATCPMGRLYDLYCYREVTIARMAAFKASGSDGHASITLARSESAICCDLLRGFAFRFDLGESGALFGALFGSTPVSFEEFAIVRPLLREPKRELTECVQPSTESNPSHSPRKTMGFLFSSSAAAKHSGDVLT